MQGIECLACLADYVGLMGRMLVSEFVGIGRRDVASQCDDGAAVNVIEQHMQVVDVPDKRGVEIAAEACEIHGKHQDLGGGRD